MFERGLGVQAKRAALVAVGLCAALGAGKAAGGEAAPEAKPSRDDGSVWTARNEWNADWELKYSQWVADNIDADFFVRIRMETDCADVPYLVRWIFARIHSLPQGCHDRFGNVFGHWCTDFSRLPRSQDWKRDDRFMAALARVNEMSQSRSFPFDTYPIAVLPEAGYLRPGAVVNDEHHSRTITEVDRRSFFPIITSASTLPPQVRPLTVEMLNRDCEFDAAEGYGICNFNWWRRNAADGRWETVPDEQMPGYSLEQFTLVNKVEEEHLALHLQNLYAYKVEDPNQALQEMMADLHSAVQTRLDVVDRGWANYRGNRGSKGDTTSDDYDFFSTNQRDARIKNKFYNLSQFVKRGYFAEDELNNRLAKETFRLSSGKELTFLELGYSVQHKLLSPEPWDPPERRWGMGGFRLEWHRSVGGNVDCGLVGAPDGAVVAALNNSTLVALSREGKKLWEFRTADKRSALPACDESGICYVADASGALTAVNARGKKVWSAPAQGSDFATPALGGADGRIYTASDRGYVQAFNRANGSLLWTTQLDRGLRGPATGGDGPLIVAAEKGRVYGVSREGQAVWDKTIAGRIYAPPMADAQGNGYVLCDDGKVYSFSPDGTLRWTYDTGERQVFPGVVGPDGKIYVIAGSTLICLEPSGRRRWAATAGDAIYAPPSVGPDGRVYVGSIDYHLYAISPGGEIRWTFQTPSSLLSSPYLAPDGRIYVGPKDQRVYALRDRD